MGGKKREKEKPQKPDILLEETKQYLETELGKSAAVIIIIPSSQGWTHISKSFLCDTQKKLVLNLSPISSSSFTQ